MTVRSIDGKSVCVTYEAPECWAGCDDPHCPYIHNPSWTATAEYHCDGDVIGRGSSEEDAIADYLRQIAA